MFRTLTTLLAIGTAVAMPSVKPRQSSSIHKLLIGTPFQILTGTFDGSKFAITGNHTAAGTAPSWMLYKSPALFYAVNENANDTSLFTLDCGTGNPTFKSAANGSSGVVFLEFNSDKTRMVGAAYGSGMIDVWDVSAQDGSLKLLKNIVVPGEPNPAQGAHHPHQALLDPTGRYFVIPDLGGDSVHVLDSKDDKYEITNTISLPVGSGPRHGGFITDGDTHYYALATELSSELYLFELKYDDDKLNLTQVQKQSTYGAAFPPANATSAAAGELVVASNNRDVYVSNRLSGNETDSIAHFTYSGAKLDFYDSVSSGGILPRMFSLSTDEKLVFVANQAGDAALAAFKRTEDSGELDPTPVATLPQESLVAPALAATPSMGPQFVLEI
ncbi:putative isomerase YbhE [Hypoxylon rubiginosum]|uniref:Isomerase YbhE n=1 Tax=Hypoxylon rubiginosum TaxID=110542 RepID=A0ACC0CYM1_9PEZI|nr:putative isomerase YbhE [Hypoxylon rubiginosum]